MRTLLKLQEHKHTAKKLPHHHTSYRGLFVVLAACGLAILTIQHVGAATYNVTAKVSAPLPSSPAVITEPKDSQILESANIDVKGTCPVIQPAIIILIWRAGSLLGSGVCGSDGQFSIPITLLAGPNALTPKIMNITDDAGPDGDTIVASYSPPGGIINILKPSPHEPVNKIPLDEYQPVRLEIDKNFIVFQPNQEASVPISIEDGEAPYRVQVSWGDGTGSDFIINNSGKRDLHHTYQSTISYTIRIVVTDKRGKTSQRSIAAVTFARPITVQQNLSPTDQPPTVPQAWIAYGVVMVAATSFWIGELFRQNQLAKIRVQNVRQSRQLKAKRSTRRKR